MPQLRDTNIKNIQPLPSPNDYIEKLPVSDKIANVVAKGRQEIADILAGRDERLLVITGPCSVHDTKASLEYASRLKDVAAKYNDRILVVMRVYFEKPRTTVGWKGLIYDPQLNGSCDITLGLGLAREFLLKVGEMGVLAATEFVDPITPQYIADLVSWAAIGARTVESQTHRQMASGLSMPVGFKNGTGGTIQIAVDAVVTAQEPHGFLGVDGNGRASIVMTKSNPNCHIVLRGGARGPNYDSKTVGDAIAMLQKAGVRTQLVVDCSHANSSKDYSKQAAVFRDVLAQRHAGNKNIVGLMLESHLFAGAQKLDEKNPGALKYGVSITDACISWEENAELLAEAYKAAGSPQTARR